MNLDNYEFNLKIYIFMCSNISKSRVLSFLNWTNRLGKLFSSNFFELMYPSILSMLLNTHYELIVKLKCEFMKHEKVLHTWFDKVNKII